MPRWLLMLSCLVASPLFAQRPPDITLDAKMNRAAIDGVLKAIDKYYVSPAIAKEINETIRARMERGEYDKIKSAFDLIDVMDEQLQAISKDAHLKVSYNHRGSPLVEGADDLPDSPEDLAEDRKAARESNFGIERAARLPGNIGHLDVRAFHRPEYAGETVGAAMTLLANTDALIIDLRNSRGGTPDMVLFLVSYFFAGEEPFHLGDFYSRPTDETQQLWTLPYVPGKRYVGKDVYILMSKRTFSAPEGFASFMQHHKRATVVGEPTRGGTHPGMMIKVHEHFGVFVPMDKPVYPIGTPRFVLGRPFYEKWEADDDGRPVKPDIEVPAEQALKTAHLEALQKKVAKEPKQKEDLQPLIENLKQELNR